MGLFDNFFGKDKDEDKKKEEKKKVKKDKQEKKQEQKKPKKKDKQKKSRVPLQGSALKEPVISEKSRDMTHEGKYVFLVEDWANKNSIKKEVENRWNVSVENVNTMRTETKAKKLSHRSGGTIVGNKSVKKKAIVTLSEGDSIDIFPV